ncbi:hypothetical protein [Proteus faecis]|uniref:hypothetical protein n=1 Tax=Proteus faecis TaxID=2050967 RepID=UPI003075E518
MQQSDSQVFMYNVGIIEIVKYNSLSDFNICFEIDIACEKGRGIITNGGNTCEFYKLKYSNGLSDS